VYSSVNAARARKSSPHEPHPGARFQALPTCRRSASAKRSVASRKMSRGPEFGFAGPPRRRGRGSPQPANQIVSGSRSRAASCCSSPIFFCAFPFTR
jgi:hypothetical protein